MRGLVKFLLILLALVVVVGGAAWMWAGRSEGPVIQIRQPERFVGQATTLDLLADSPGGRFSRLDVTVEQAGKTYPVFTLAQPAKGGVRQFATDGGQPRPGGERDEDAAAEGDAEKAEDHRP